MDKLEKYIIENRDKFEHFSAPMLGKSNRPPTDGLEAFIWLYRSKLKGFWEKDMEQIWQKIEPSLSEGEKKDSLESWLESHQDELDVHEPSLENWSAIAQRLPSPLEVSKKPGPTVQPEGKKEKVITISVNRLRQMAAAIAFLMVCGAAFFFWQTPIEEEKHLSARQIEKQVDRLAPELSETELYYQMVIHEKLEKIRGYDEALSERIRKDFFEELSTLDEAYQTMKRELVESQSNEQVISAMIHNLQLRIDVLNKQLEILNDIESQPANKKDHETINL